MKPKRKARKDKIFISDVEIINLEQAVEGYSACALRGLIHNKSKSTFNYFVIKFKQVIEVKQFIEVLKTVIVTLEKINKEGK